MKKTALELTQIGVGTLIAALGVSLFMIPNKLASGGLNGLVLVFHYLWGVPVGMTYFLLNVPAFFWIFRVKGWTGVAKTAFGIATFSFFLEATQGLEAFAPTHNLLLATIFAGVTVGGGLGIAMRVGGSTGGTTAMGQVVHQLTGFDVGKFLLLTDMAILVFGGVMLSPEMILYGLVMSFLVTTSVKRCLEGFSTSRCLFVISERPDEVRAALLRELKRGVTELQGMGGYTGSQRPVILCVVSETEVGRARRLALEADPQAFLIVTDARDVSGQGFTIDTDIRSIGFWASQRGA